MATFNVGGALVEAAPVSFFEVEVDTTYLRMREDAILLIGVTSKFQPSTHYSSACWWGTLNLIGDITAGTIHHNDKKSQKPIVFLDASKTDGMIYKVVSVDGVRL